MAACIKYLKNHYILRALRDSYVCDVLDKTLTIGIIARAVLLLLTFGIDPRRKA